MESVKVRTIVLRREGRGTNVWRAITVASVEACDFPSPDWWARARAELASRAVRGDHQQ